MMLPVKEAESIIMNLVQPLDNQRDVEIVDLFAATGRILATAVRSELNFPHWDNSAMDGYAVRYADVQNASEENPAILEVIEEISAGYQPKQTIHKGQTARILTGAVMPIGADTIVIQELVRRQGNQVFVLATPKPQEFVRHKGEFYQAGAQLLPGGIRLSAPEIAALAAAQCSQLSVYRKPKVAVLSTGNELVTPDQPLKAGQIVDSNQYALASVIIQSGAEPLMLGIVKDEPEALTQAMAIALQSADVVISSGGVSVGDYDYVEKLLESNGGTIHIRSVAVKPGKPLTVASFEDKLYFGLPGNPVSALVTFWRFVQPAIKKLAGISQDWKPKFIIARTHYDLHSDGKRESYLWGKLDIVDGIYEFHLAGGSHSSGNLINLAQTNALGIVPIGQTLIPKGEEIQVMLVDL